MNPRVKSILAVRPFLVTVKWTNDEITVIDFHKFLSGEREKKHPIFSKLFNSETFIKVKTDGRTLFWEDMTEMLDEGGQVISAPLDFCPDVLYDISQEASKDFQI